MNSYSETISRITSKHDIRDLFGTIKIRMGIRRNAYRVTPGLYSIGDPDEGSPVLVTANYKLTFDHLRKNLSNVDAWILVLDTKGINVWCAAGKGTFSTDEVVRRVQESNLGEFVDHRRLILPQLSAVGVAAHEVKRRSGFSVAYGPIRARDIKRYLANGEKVDDGMRDVTFSLTERLILTPLEILAVWKPFTLLILLGIFVISGISPSIFSPEPAFIRTGMMCIALLSGIFLGAFVTPTLLPWIPGRAFAWKGFAISLVAAVFALPQLRAHTNHLAAYSLCVAAITISSFSAMNFTGSTPFTSPSGVEREMRIAIPLQLIGIVLAITLWIWSVFI